MRKLVAFFAGAALAAGAVFFAGCETMDALSEGAASVAVASGVVSAQQGESIARAGKAIGKTFSDITPEQEYYIGRTVAATVLTSYKPLINDALTVYLNTLGQALAEASDKPETFGGYHFLALDSADINAFAAPGGLIFVTRGLLECCETEDAVAAVLAHEIGHVQHQHGLRQIKSGRLTSALTILAAEGVKSFAGQDLAQLTEAFEGSISDITTTMIQNGYSRDLEYQADAAALEILRRTGYDPRALVAMLKIMQARLKPGGSDFAKTHPSPADRITRAQKRLASLPALPAASAARTLRMKKALGRL